MKALLTITSLVFSLSLLAQKPEAIIQRADITPVIGGGIDAAWEAANVYDIDKPYQSELTTIPGGATWRGLWNNEGIYLLTEVGDDFYYPWYAPDPDGANRWQYDKAEIFFDVNYELLDGIGPTDGGANGHWMIAPDVVEGKADGTLIEENGFTWAFTDKGDGSYFAEYFIPFDMLTDKDGYVADLSEEVGFDVYIVDNDDLPEGSQQRVVWANTGKVDEAWANMDDCGILIFDGAGPMNYVAAIQLEDIVIDENNGKVQVQALVSPSDATNQNLNWSIENGTGRATIDGQGVVTGLVDGTAIVTAFATDGSYVEESCTVTISKQIVSMDDLNLIRNGNYHDLNADLSPAVWSSFIVNADLPAPIVEGGVLAMFPDGDEANPQEWYYRHFQNGLQASLDVAYEFSFVAWADEDADLPVCFQDGPENNYHYYGISTSEWSENGRSKWHVPIGTEPAKYAMDVTFIDILSNSDQMVGFWPGLLTMGVYLDSVYLINPDDLDLLTDHIAVDSITVSGDSFIKQGSAQLMVSEVFPANATFNSVNWSVIPGTGLASIDHNGLMTGDAPGTVTVMCSAIDDSHAYGIFEVTIHECDFFVGIEADVWNESCPGKGNGSIYLMLSGDTTDFSYEWSNGETNPSNNHLDAGDYEVIITDSDGCPRVRSYSILPAIPLIIEFNAIAPSCHHENNGELAVEVSGGVEPYGVLWGNGSDSKSLSGLSAESYDVLITDANGCEASASFILSEPDSLVIRMDVQNVSCFGEATGSIWSSVSGGSPPYSFAWNNGGVTQGFKSLAAGKYICTLEDRNGCIAIDSVEITEFAQVITSEIAGSQNVAVSGIETYSVNQTIGSIFSWEVTGGNIISGQQSNVIEVQWLGAGEGLISVWEMDKRSCSGDPKSVTVTIKYPASVSVNTSSSFSIYPNPAQERFTIEANYLSPCLIEIRSINGKLLHITNMEGNSIDISLSSFQNGIYFITVKSKDFVVSKKLIKF